MITPLPYNCSAWVCTPQSSNCVGFGVRGDDLVVLFKGNSAYLYPTLAICFTEMYNAPSVGKYINENCKHVPGVAKIKDESYE